MHSPISLLKTILIIFFLSYLLLISCKSEVIEKPKIDVTTKADSISYWISEGRDIGQSLDFRKQSLLDAYLSIQSIKNDTLQAKYLSQVSAAYLSLDDSINFRNSNTETFNLAVRINDSVMQAESHWDLADYFSDKAVPDSAFYHFAAAQKIYNGLKDDFMAARMLYNMANVQADVKDYTGSEINTISAIELLKPLRKDIYLFYCYNLLGSISLEINEYDRALEYYETAITYLDNVEEAGNLKQMSKNNIGVVYQEQGNHTKAIPLFKSFLEQTGLRRDEPLMYSRTLSNLVYSRFKIKDTAGIISLFNEAITIQDSINDINGIARTHYNLAEFYLEQKDTTLALVHAHEAKIYATESNNNQRLLQTLRLFTHLDPKNTYAYAEEYITLDDSLQREERRIRDKFARIRFETNEVLLNNQLLARQRQLWIGIASGLLLLAIAAFIIINQIRRNQKLQFQRKQQESNQEIFNLLLSQKGKLEEGKHLEQRRVSEELHDSILSQMLGIRLVLTALNGKTDDGAITKRAELLKKLQELEEEIRTISHELNAASYQKIHNFMGSIQDLLESFKSSSKINFEFIYDSEVDWDQLNGDIKINLYRIVQEILQNCVKHALAQNISLRFAFFNEMLDFSISDDGKGFDVSKAKRGIGMKNIASRLDKIGGTWNIDSKIGQGTKISIEVPRNTMSNLKSDIVSEDILQNV